MWPFKKKFVFPPPLAVEPTIDGNLPRDKWVPGFVGCCLVRHNKESPWELNDVLSDGGRFLLKISDGGHRYLILNPDSSVNGWPDGEWLMLDAIHGLTDAAATDANNESKGATPAAEQ